MMVWLQKFERFCLFRKQTQCALNDEYNMEIYLRGEIIRMYVWGVVKDIAVADGKAYFGFVLVLLAPLRQQNSTAVLVIPCPIHPNWSS